MFIHLVLFATLASAGVILYPVPRAADAITLPASTPSITPTLGANSFFLDASLLTDLHLRTLDAAAEPVTVSSLDFTILTDQVMEVDTRTLEARDAVETVVA
ncbi:hypothetical protein C8J56DRAFT_1049171 [Mycena floridula]|nr:hypothetical protein C8J56DRAFT_1049171 [Mycena floridula]